MRHTICLDDESTECLGNTRERGLDTVKQAALVALAFGFDLAELSRCGARRLAFMGLLVSLVRLDVNICPRLGAATSDRGEVSIGVPME